MQKLYFIRHGQSVLNKQGLMAGTTETPLTEEGRQQASATGKHMKQSGIRIDFIVASPRSRAIETAQIIAKELSLDPKKIHVNDLFAERHYGELEGKPWSPDLNLDGMSDMETEDTLIERAHLALEWLENFASHDNHVLVVSHGGFGRAFRSVVHKSFPLDYTFRIANAELVELL